MLETHLIERSKFHSKWNRNLPPVARVNQHDTVKIETNDAIGGQITLSSRAEDLAKTDSSVVHPITGPIYVKGAKAGDTLVVKILDIKTNDWGFTGILPGMGFLPNEFPKNSLAFWKVGKDGFLRSESIPGVKVPIAPFCGIMGVAPGEDGEFSTMPPGSHGGNMDIKYLTKGSTLYLPIMNEGALFSVGDVHIAQGDGEVCVTGVETSATVKLQFSLKEGQVLSEPYFETSTHFSTVGSDTNLDEACRKALRNLIHYLTREKQMTRESAYMLASIVADLKIFEVVDLPNVLAGAMIPKSSFD
jgi:acetamidase/formamidase